MTMDSQISLHLKLIHLGLMSDPNHPFCPLFIPVIPWIRIWNNASLSGRLWYNWVKTEFSGSWLKTETRSAAANPEQDAKWSKEKLIHSLSPLSTPLPELQLFFQKLKKNVSDISFFHIKGKMLFLNNVFLY